jgi:aminopeptidase YwaD
VRVISGLCAIAMAAAALGWTPAGSAAKASGVCAECVKATMQKLAGDELRGRACGSPDENAAARYLADALQKLGIRGGLPDGGYLQPVKLLTPTYAAPPALDLTGPTGATLRLVNGQDMVLQGSPPASLDAPLIRVADAGPPFDDIKGKVVIFDGGTSLAVAATLQKLGAAAVILAAPDSVLEHWGEMAVRGPGRTDVLGGVPRAPASTAAPLIFVRSETFATLLPLAAGQAHIAAPRGEPIARTTYNVIGVRHGTTVDADHYVVLLSAHYDHLGVRDGVIFHGADDDASGTAAVMELARILGTTPARRRTAIFSLFGCEEEGGLGAQYFLSHRPPAITGFTANLEFEMIGVDDPKHPGFLMLTGWGRSTLGPMLAAHGAKVVADPYPDQHFFRRSDNYQLALQGVIAQTVSAWPVPPTYHAASDDLAHVDLGFMDQVIGSLVGPVTWLLDSDFVPVWNPGQQP